MKISHLYRAIGYLAEALAGDYTYHYAATQAVRQIELAVTLVEARALLCAPGPRDPTEDALNLALAALTRATVALSDNPSRTTRRFALRDIRDARATLRGQL